MSIIINSDQTPEFYFQERCHIAELLNTVDCPGLSIARARVAPGVTTVLHLVRGAEEVYYLLSGQGDVEIAGKVIGIMRPGDLLRIPADTPQRINNTGGEDLVFLAICAPRFEGERYEEVNQS
jgi:mannose-6-phosphate isomerase-like protein (cupin superfamily)